MKLLHPLKIAGLASVLAISTLAAGSDDSKSEFVGAWEVSDSSGNPFEISVNADGTAGASRAGEGMKGTWKEEGSSAVIKWDTGWTTKIEKAGGSYKKLAYEKDLTAAPKNTSDAKKVK